MAKKGMKRVSPATVAARETRRKNRVRKLLAESEPVATTIENIGELVVDEWGVPMLIDDVEEFRLTGVKRTKEQSEECKNRLNAIRQELTSSANSFDIIHYFANRWGITTHRVKAYLKTAKAMNRQILDLTHAEAKADSVSFWSLESQRLAKDRAKADSLLDDGNKLLTQARELTSQALETGNAELATKARDLAQRARELMSMARSIKNGAIDRGHEVRDRLDKILGTLAPIKVDVKVDGAIEHKHTAEPITFEEIVRKLAQAEIDNPTLGLADMLYTEIAKLRGTVITGELANVESKLEVS